MPIKDQISIEDIRLLVWNLTESIDELQKQFKELNNKEFDKIVSDKRKREYLGVRLALKTLLGKEIPIEYDTDGKPSLMNKSYQISISHCKNWIAVIAHPTCSVGIDIECPTDKIQKICSRFLSITELKDLSKGKDINQLLLAWSVKEALYKIIGKDAVDFANQLRIFPFEVKTEGEIIAQHVPTKRLYQLHYTQNQTYTLVYCMD
jgi:Phosphopantetheinyl transferase